MTENILIWAAKRGSQSAFKQLFDKHFKSVYYFLLQFSDDADEVEDWVQLSFIRAFEKLNDFKGGSKFSTWLIAISLNVMRRSKGAYYSRMREKLDVDLHDSVDQPDCEFVWRHDMKWLLKSLDEQKRAVFILYEVEGLSHAEIADLLEISLSNSKVLLNRAKKELQNKWLNEEKND